MVSHYSLQSLKRTGFVVHVYFILPCCEEPVLYLESASRFSFLFLIFLCFEFIYFVSSLISPLFGRFC